MIIFITASKGVLVWCIQLFSFFTFTTSLPFFSHTHKDKNKKQMQRWGPWPCLGKKWTHFDQPKCVFFGPQWLFTVATVALNWHVFLPGPNKSLSFHLCLSYSLKLFFFLLPPCLLSSHVCLCVCIYMSIHQPFYRFNLGVCQSLFIPLSLYLHPCCPLSNKKARNLKKERQKTELELELSSAVTLSRAVHSFCFLFRVCVCTCVYDCVFA